MKNERKKCCHKKVVLVQKLNGVVIVDPNFVIDNPKSVIRTTKK